MTVPMQVHLGEGGANISALKGYVGADGAWYQTAVQDSFGGIEGEVSASDADVELHAAGTGVECFAKEGSAPIACGTSPSGGRC